MRRCRSGRHIMAAVTQLVESGNVTPVGVDSNSTGRPKFRRGWALVSPADCKSVASGCGSSTLSLSTSYAPVV